MKLHVVRVAPVDHRRQVLGTKGAAEERRKELLEELKASVTIEEIEIETDKDSLVKAIDEGVE